MTNILKLNLCLFCIYLFILINSLKIKPKFCVNCKFFIIDNENNEYSTCMKFPEKNNKFLVTGNYEVKNFNYCSIARHYDDMCGVNATKYVKKRENKKII